MTAVGLDPGGSIIELSGARAVPKLVHASGSWASDTSFGIGTFTASATGGSVITRHLAAPSEGDLVVCVVTNVAASTPSGWSVGHTGTLVGLEVRIFYRLWPSSAPSWSFAAGGRVDLYVFRSASWFDAEVATATNDTTDVTAPAIGPVTRRPSYVGMIAARHATNSLQGGVQAPAGQTFNCGNNGLGGGERGEIYGGPGNYTQIVRSVSLTRTKTASHSGGTFTTFLTSLPAVSESEGAITWAVQGAEAA